MTDKQIIIDGTQCRYAHFDGGNTQRLLCAIDDCFCDCHRENDCYYKQYKRSEAQCEAMFVTHTDLEKKYKAKEQECETLASQLDFEVQKKECLERECKELKSAFVRAECQIADDEILQCDMREAIEGLKAENEELKEELAKVRMEICNQCGEKDDYNIPCKQIRDLDYGLQLEIEENYKLKQTLTEIKDIAENFCSESCPYKDDDCDICVEDCFLDEIVNPILQKISEVEDEK